MDASWFGLIGGIGILLGFFVFLDRMLAARERHWELPDDERPRSPQTGVGNALMELHGILQPGARAGVEEQQRRRNADEGEGDPPDDPRVHR